MRRPLAPAFQPSPDCPVLHAPIDAPRGNFDVLAVSAAAQPGLCHWPRTGPWSVWFLPNRESFGYDVEDMISAELEKLRFRGTIIIEDPLPPQEIRWRTHSLVVLAGLRAAAAKRGLPIVGISRRTVSKAFGADRAGFKALTGSLRKAGLGSYCGVMPDRSVWAACLALVGGIEPGWRR